MYDRYKKRAFPALLEEDNPLVPEEDNTKERQNMIHERIEYLEQEIMQLNIRRGDKYSNNEQQKYILQK